MVKKDPLTERSALLNDAGSPTVNIAINSDDDDDSAKAGSVSFCGLFRYATGADRLLMLWGTVCGLVSGLGMPAFAFIFGKMLDELADLAQDPDQHDEILERINELALQFLIVGLVCGVAAWWSMCIWMITAETQTKKVRERYVQSVIRQDMTYMDSKSQGELAAKLNEDALLYQTGVGDKMHTLFMTTSTFLGGLGLGLYLGWQLALVVLAATPVLAIVMGMMGAFITSMQANESKAYEKAGRCVDQALGGIRTVTAFSGQPLETQRYLVFLQEAFKAGVKKRFTGGSIGGALYLVMFSTYGLALWWGYRLIEQGVIAPGTGEPYQGSDVVAVFFACIIGAFSLGQLGPAIPAIISAKTAAYNLFQVIERESEIDPLSEDGLVLGDNYDTTLSLDQVHFRYATRKDMPVFQGMDLTVRAGEKVALVGASGSGKSTVVALLERFYDPEKGSVSLGGHDLRTLNVAWWRSQLGLVSQEPILFQGSVQDNILWGKPDATSAEVVAAAKAANAHKFIKRLPSGYNTNVGEGGSQLSGGQKQRIAIARAIIRNPKIVLLDEATSALDNESEKMVQKALDRMMENRTTVIVAHRLSTIRNADRIFVLSEGKVVETGTHDQLMQRQSAYYNLVQAQQHSHDQEMASLEKDVEQRSETREERRASVTSVEDSGMQMKEEDEDEEAQKLRDAIEKDASKTKWEVTEVPTSRVWHMLRGDWKHLVLGTAGASLMGGLSPMFAIIFGNMLEVFYDTDPTQARNMALMFCGLGVAMLLAALAQSYGFAVPGEKLTRDLREEGYKAVLRQEIGFFDDETHNSRVLAARLSADAARVNAVATTQLSVMVQTAFLLLIGLGIAFYFSWQMALVVLAISPLLMITGAIQMKVVMSKASKDKAEFAKASKLSSQAFDHLRTVTSFSAEQHTLEQYSKALEFPVSQGKKKANLAGLALGLTQVVTFGSYALAFWAGAEIIDRGNVDFADLMKSIFAIVMSASGAGQVQSMLPDLAEARAAKDYIFYLIDRVSAINPTDEGGVRDSVTEGHIRFENVSFSYPTRPDAKALDNVNLELKPGQSVALVGESGAGKSSIVQLLLRFYDTASGSITIDGVQITKYHLQSLRQQFGLVSQEPTLFDMTIRENIAYGKPSATEAEIIAAAKSANIHNVIMDFPDTYDTVCGAKGTQLSGGQKQRVAIARAILRNPKILLLDEATSALDAESEQVVQAALERLIAQKQRTTLVIAHRLSTVRNCDVIVVMDKGRVVEVGSHAELIAKDGMFAALVRAAHHSGAALSAK